MELGLWTPIVSEIPNALSSLPDSKPSIPYSTSTIFPDSSFRSTSKSFRESRIPISLHGAHKCPFFKRPLAKSFFFFFFNAPWLSILGSWARHLSGKVFANLARYLETVGTGSQRVLCFFVLPLSSEVLPGKQQKLLAFFGGGQIQFPLLQINSLTGNKWVYKLLTFGWC